MQLDPTTLRVFISAVEEGTIANTAARERIAPAAVSKRLSELEAALHTQLFIRSNKGIKPTTAGLALINLARRVLHDIEDVYVQMRDYASGTRGYVRVFANISAITQFLPRDLHAFLTKHPQIQINLEERISTAITKAVSENAADIGLFTYGTPSHGLKTIPYREDDLVLIVPAHHPLVSQKDLSFKDVLDFDFVGLHAGSWMNLEAMKAASALGRTMKLRIQVSGYDALCLMVEAGLGIGILPKNSAKPYLPALGIKALPLNEAWAHRQLAVCMRSYEELSLAARLLVDHLLAPTSSKPTSRKMQESKIYKR
jgi:DNA-binding transcriptional LysR family regulator